MAYLTLKNIHTLDEIFVAAKSEI